MNGMILTAIIIVGVILAVIAILIVIKTSKKPAPTPKKREAPKKESFEFSELMKVVQNPNTTSKELLEVLKIFNQYFRLDDKKAHDYLIFLSKCLTHPNVDKNVFQYFHNEVKPNNPKYKSELEMIEMKALG